MKSSRKTIAKTAAIMVLLLALLAGGLFFVTRSSSPAARLLRQGNQAFADNNFMDALGIYQLAQSRFPQLAEPFYNAANALSCLPTLRPAKACKPSSPSSVSAACCNTPAAAHQKRSPQGHDAPSHHIENHIFSMVFRVNR